MTVHTAASGSSGVTPRRSPRLIVVGAPAAFIYLIIIGGTPFGELLGWIRAANALLAAGVILAYFNQAQFRADRIDRGVLLALLLFAAASVFSSFPRQSFDALLAALAYAAGFYVMRTAARDRAARNMMVRAMMLLSVIVTGLVIVRSLSIHLEWLSLTRGTVLPPIGLSVPAWPWGHPYDVALLAMMLFPSWLVGSPGLLRRVGALLMGVLVVFLVVSSGSRNLWLALGGATILLGLPVVAAILRMSRGAKALGAIGLLAVVTLLFATLGGTLLDRLSTLSTLGQRFTMWSASVDAWMDRPIAGYGPGAFPWVLQRTDYFDTNSLAPRHPDSALFQLLPEAGLLGIAAVAVLVLILLPALARSHLTPARWALAAFLIAAIGANPTDFPYLIVAAVVWAALALPRFAAVAAPGRTMRPRVRMALIAGLGIAGIAYASTLAAGVIYDSAFEAIGLGQDEAAQGQLDTAVLLDPGMALYSRQRGTLRLLQGDPGAAVDDLERATALNSSDDLAWRTLAMAYRAEGDLPASTSALGRAIDTQRSDPTNLMLSAFWESTAGDSPDVRRTIGEIVQAWPNALASPTWREALPGWMTPAEAIGTAIDRWQGGALSPEPMRGQPLWLTIVGGRPELLDEAIGPSGLTPALVDATLAVWGCDPSAEQLLASVPNEERQSGAYWSLVIRSSAENGEVDTRAARLYAVATNDSIWQEALNPLHENSASGYSADAWGYRRLPIVWGPSGIELPSPESGSSRWLVDPQGARRAIGLVEGPGQCR